MKFFDILSFIGFSKTGHQTRK